MGPLTYDGDITLSTENKPGNSGDKNKRYYRTVNITIKAEYRGLEINDEFSVAFYVDKLGLFEGW